MDLHSERGVTFGPIIGIVVIVLAIIGLFAVCTGDDADVDTLGRIELVSHDYDDGCWDGRCYGGERWDDGWGGGSDGNTGYDGEGGRSGDYDGGEGDGHRCRNFCFYGVPAPGQEGTA